MMWGREEALFFHRLIARTRALHAVLELRRSKIEGPVLTGLGAEGLCIGIGFALYEAGILAESKLTGDQRTQYGFGVVKNEAFPEAHDHGYEILKNHALAATSASEGEDGNIHWGCLEHGILPFACSDMGRMIPVLMGMIEEVRRQQWPAIGDSRKRPVAVGAFGEGALNQGCIPEAFNWTAASNCRLTDGECETHAPWMDEIGKFLRVLRGTPMIFVVNRNQFSIYTDAREGHGRSDIVRRANGYGNMRGVSVEGWNVFDVIEKMRKAIYHAQGLRATLIDAETYRLTGHNADQVKRKPGVLNEGEILGLDPKEFQWAWEFRDPLKHCRETLIEWEYAVREELETVEQEETKRAEGLFDQAWREPEPTLEDRKKRTLFIPHVWAPPTVSRDHSGGTMMRYNEALVWEFARELREDPRVTMFGEDIHRGGVVRETGGRGGYFLSKEFGEVRVHTTPISEEVITEVAAGRALAGGKPKCFYQFLPFWADAYVAWRSVISTNWWQKKMRFDMVAVAPFGVVHGGGSGEYHEACAEGVFASMGGIVLCFPATAYEVVGMLRAAHEYPGPVVLFLQIRAFGDSEFAEVVPEEPYIIPFGQAKVRREGSDVSVLVYGAAAVKAACNEAEFLAREGVALEVVDIQCVDPLDIDTLVASATKTGRVIIMHEARKRQGCGVSIKDALDEAGASTSAKTLRVSSILGAEDNPIPTKKSFLWARLPFEQYVVRPQDNFGEERTILRSSKLAHLARELMQY